MKTSELAETAIHLEELGEILRMKPQTEENDRKATIIEAAFDIVTEIVRELEKESMELYAWDELSNEIEVRERAELDAINKEGGWEYKETLPNGVVVLATDRHYALEVMAKDVNDADAKFSEFAYYVQVQEDSKETE